jgi:hypothetical protein
VVKRRVVGGLFHYCERVKAEDALINQKHLRVPPNAEKHEK